MKAFLLLISFTLSGIIAAQDTTRAPVIVNSNELIQQGIKMYDEGRYEDAISYVKQVPESDTAYALALYEHALSYRALKKPKESIPLLKKGLSMWTNYRRSFYEMLGSSYDEAGDFQNSLKTYKQGLEEFPTYDMFYNEIAVAYSNHKEGDSALANFIKAVQLNPLRPLNHLKLSAFLIGNNQFVPALMSYLIYSSLESNTSRSFTQLAAYEKILKKEQVLDNDTALKLNYNVEQFMELELIIKSNMAVSNDYKVPGKLNYPYLIKNFHLLMEKIQINKDNNDIWNTFYMETLKKIYNEKRFQLFVLNIFSTVNSDDVKKEVKKKKKDIEEFQTWMIQLFYNKYMKDRTSMVEGKSVTAEHSYYSNGNIKLIVKYDKIKSINTGPCYLFYKNGILNAKGAYDMAGKKDGEWMYYLEDGTISSLQTAKAGILHGPYVIYYPNGALKEKGSNVNGKAEGEVQYFYSHGALKRQNMYANDKVTGIITEYHDNDILAHTVPVGDDNLYEGVIKRYYPNGNLNYVANYKKGLLDGSYKTYYENSGILKQEGSFLNDKRIGKLIDYYANGKPQKVEDNYVAGKLNGFYIKYYANGNIHEQGTYTDDLLEGEYVVNDSTGRMYARYTYDKNNLKSVFFYGIDNKQIAQINGSNKKYQIKKYFDSGALNEEGTIVNNLREGVWKQYFKNGNLRQDLNYVANNLNGVCKTYFKYGQLETEVNYTNDERDGLYKEYHINGKLKQQGWYVKGTAQQMFYNYSETGSLKSQVYLLHGERNGPVKIFDLEGKLNNIEYYDKALLYKVECYDTLGNIIQTSENAKGTGKLFWYHLNGKINVEIDYKNGYVTGTKKVFYNNGALYFELLFKNGMAYGPCHTFNSYKKPIYESYYKKDLLDSIYTQYDFDGHKTSVMYYKYGELNGPREWFYPNGKIEISGTYKDDERNGAFIYYALDGTIMMQRNYIDGIFVSYSYKNANGQMITPIPVGYNQDIVAYYPNGTKSTEFSFVLGATHGVLKAWHPNGKLKEESGRYYGDFEGAHKEYYENGKVMLDEFYKDDHLSGECKYYYETGKLKRSTVYLKGVRHGKEMLYDKDGKKISDLVFYDGEIAK